MVRLFVAAIAFASFNVHAGETLRPYSCARGEAGLECLPTTDMSLTTCEEGPEIDRPVIIRSGWIHDAILQPRTTQPEQADPFGSEVVRPISPIAADGARCGMMVPQHVADICQDGVVVMGTNGDTCRPKVEGPAEVGI